MTKYAETEGPPALFPPRIVPSLAAVYEAAGLRQFHVAETEKYAHVTYFFNGRREGPFSGERRLLIPSSRVATYDPDPAMRTSTRLRTMSSRPWKPYITRASTLIATRVGTLRPGRTRS